MVVTLSVQLVVVKSAFCCKTQPSDGLFQYGQETVSALPELVTPKAGIGVATSPY